MNRLELVGSRGINKRFRGIKDRGEMRFENTWGAKMPRKIEKLWCETDRRMWPLASHFWASGRSPGGSKIASR